MDTKVKTFSILDAIGNTPLLRIEGIYAKLESVNPSGSIKDRAALAIIEDAERDGRLKPGYTIVEASSGNMGISLAMVAAVKGYKMTVVMPENMSEERKQMMRGLGAELILTSTKGSLGEAVATAESIGKRPNTFLSRQFSNPANIRAQEKLGAEILDELGPVDAIVAGVGTGGTLMGIANTIRRANPNVKVVAVEPAEAAVMFKGESPVIGPHRSRGSATVLSRRSWTCGGWTKRPRLRAMRPARWRERWRKSMASSSESAPGANVVAAIRTAAKYGKTVTVLPDRGERYLSMNLFTCP